MPWPWLSRTFRAAISQSPEPRRPGVEVPCRSFLPAPARAVKTGQGRGPFVRRDMGVLRETGAIPEDGKPPDQVRPGRPCCPNSVVADLESFGSGPRYRAGFRWYCPIPQDRRQPQDIVKPSGRPCAAPTVPPRCPPPGDPVPVIRPGLQDIDKITAGNGRPSVPVQAKADLVPDQPCEVESIPQGVYNEPSVLPVNRQSGRIRNGNQRG